VRSVLPNRRLGDVLVASGALTNRQLRELLASREVAWVRPGDLAVEEGYIELSQLAAALSLPESRRPQGALAS
jgi:cellulose synthase (UDP-forming)